MKKRTYFQIKKFKKSTFQKCFPKSPLMYIFETIIKKVFLLHSETIFWRPCYPVILCKKFCQEMDERFNNSSSLVM